MSLRALKKLKQMQGKADTLPNVPAANDEDSDEDDSGPAAGKGAFSQFGYLFGPYSGVISEAFEAKEEEEEKEEKKEELPAVEAPQPEKKEEKPAEKKKKYCNADRALRRKKKSKAKKAKQTAQEPKQEEPELESEETKESPAKSGPGEETKVTKETVREESKSRHGTSCLHMETKMLNADREFNKLFKDFGMGDESGAGAAGPSADEVATGMGMQLSRKAKQRLEKYKQAMSKSAKAQSHHTLLPQSDITKASVPRIISMRLCEPDENGRTCFTYDTTPEFDIIQHRFVEAQKSDNVGQLYEFVNTHYYHPECLLALSEFSRLKGAFAESNKLLERCLCVFESTWNYLYAPLKDPPNIRLDISNSKLCQYHSNPNSVECSETRCSDTWTCWAGRAARGPPLSTASLFSACGPRSTLTGRCSLSTTTPFGPASIST